MCLLPLASDAVLKAWVFLSGLCWLLGEHFKCKELIPFSTGHSNIVSFWILSCFLPLPLRVCMLWLVELWAQSLALWSHHGLLPLFWLFVSYLRASFTVVQHFRMCSVFMYWEFSYGYHLEYLLTSRPDTKMILATKYYLLVSKSRIYLSKSLCLFSGKVNLTIFFLPSAWFSTWAFS